MLKTNVLLFIPPGKNILTNWVVEKMQMSVYVLFLPIFVDLFAMPAHG